MSPMDRLVIGASSLAAAVTSLHQADSELGASSLVADVDLGSAQCTAAAQALAAWAQRSAENAKRANGDLIRALGQMGITFDDVDRELSDASAQSSTKGA